MNACYISNKMPVHKNPISVIDTAVSIGLVTYVLIDCTYLRLAGFL
jgi:hypothetical protein